jgi:hypothetical protein
MPELGDTKPCILDRCDGIMKLQTVRANNDVMFDDPARGPRQWPDPIPDYRAWVCDACGFEQNASD